RKLCLEGVDGSDRLLAVGDVGADTCRLHAELLSDFSRSRLRCVAIDVDDADVPAALSEIERGRASDTARARRASEDRGTRSGERSHRRLLQFSGWMGAGPSSSMSFLIATYALLRYAISSAVRSAGTSR